MVDRERIELSISGCKPDVFPLALTARNWSEYKDLNLGRLVPNQVCYQTTLYSDIKQQDGIFFLSIKVFLLLLPS